MSYITLLRSLDSSSTILPGHVCNENLCSPAGSLERVAGACSPVQLATSHPLTARHAGEAQAFTDLGLVNIVDPAIFLCIVEYYGGL